MTIGGWRLKPLDLIAAAQALLEGRRRPKEANLRRAQSAIYYAMFDCWARTCADGLVGGSGATRRSIAWRNTYRALEHGLAKSACRERTVIAAFPPKIAAFASAFVSLRERRHSADYDPLFKLTKSEVLADIEVAAEATEKFNETAIHDRRAFAVHVVFKRRPT